MTNRYFPTGFNIESRKEERVEPIDCSQTGSVAAGSIENTTVYAPSGYIYELLGAYINVPFDADATSGDHFVAVNMTGINLDLLYMESTYDTALIYKDCIVMSANSVQRPSAEAAQVKCLRDNRIDESNGLKIQYKNETDVAQENDRIYHLLVRKVKVS